MSATFTNLLTHEHPDIVTRPNRKLKLLVFGGREYKDEAVLNAELDGVADAQPIGLVIHGGATGADGLAGEWAKLNGIPVCIFPANWEYQGRSAGVRRNAHMLEWGEPDLAVAFPGGIGTADMLSRVKTAGIRLIEVT